MQISDCDTVATQSTVRSSSFLVYSIHDTTDAMSSPAPSQQSGMSGSELFPQPRAKRQRVAKAQVGLPLTSCALPF